jgi:hypothetical protein
MDILDYIKEERVYLHDVSNQIVIAHGMAGFVQMYLKKMENVDPKTLERIEKSINALNKIVEQTKARREAVKKVQSEITGEPI